MAKFYVVESGKLVEGVWCDNLDCIYYAGRKGIPPKDESFYAREEIISRDGKDFCSRYCEVQGPGAEARYAPTVTNSQPLSG